MEGRDPKGPREAMLGGRLLAALGVVVAGLGVLAIQTGQDLQAQPGNAEAGSLRSLVGWVLLVLAVVLVVLGISAVGGGRRTRYYAGVVGLGFGVMMILFGLPLAVVAVPFFASALLLLHSL